MVILEIDIGNSRVKWRRLANDCKEVKSRGINPDVNGFLAEQASYEKPSAVRLSNVADPKISSKIADWTGVNWNIQPIVAVVCAECSGVKSSTKMQADWELIGGWQCLLLIISQMDLA